MLRVVAVVVASVLFASQAEAKPNKTKKSGSFVTTNYQAAPATATAKKHEAYTPDSRDGRFGVAATAGLLYVGVGYGIDTWYMATKRLQLGLEVNHVATEIDARKQSGETAALNEYLNMDLTGVKAMSKFFVWNSLFVSGGLSYNLVKGEYGYYFGETDDKAGHTYTATMMMAHVGLGNQWRLRNGLILGGEWIGAGAHLNTSVKEKGDASVLTAASGVQASGTHDEDKFRKEVGEKLNQQIQFSVAMLTLGYEF